MAGMADTIVGFGVAVYIIIILFNALGLNTGLYATLTGTILPVVGIVLGVAYIRAALGGAA